MGNPIIYNVTVNVDLDIHDDWISWMREIHIPDVMNTGYFLDFRLSKIMDESEGGVSYSIMYMAKSIEAYKEYQEKHAPGLQREHSEKYRGKFAAFRTLLEVVDHG